MNLDQIKVENIKEILNQVNLSLESDLHDKNITKEDDFYGFQIYPENKGNSYDGSYRFDVAIKKIESSFFGIDTSSYNFNFTIKKKNYSNTWYTTDEFKISEKEHSTELRKIFDTLYGEYIRRDIENKNQKINQYIDLIKTTVKPQVKRDVSIDEILN